MPPVPVVDQTERQLMPGGAANAAANIVSLGARATIVGIVGALIGGWVFNYFGNYGVTGFNLYSFGRKF